MIMGMESLPNNEQGGAISNRREILKELNELVDGTLDPIKEAVRDYWFNRKKVKQIEELLPLANEEEKNEIEDSMRDVKDRYEDAYLEISSSTHPDMIKAREFLVQLENIEIQTDELWKKLDYKDSDLLYELNEIKGALVENDNSDTKNTSNVYREFRNKIGFEPGATIPNQSNTPMRPIGFKTPENPVGISYNKEYAERLINEVLEHASLDPNLQSYLNLTGIVDEVKDLLL